MILISRFFRLILLFPGSLFGFYAVLILVTFPFDLVYHQKLQNVLRRADAQIQEAFTKTGEAPRELKIFESPNTHSSREFQISRLAWEPVNLANNFKFSGGSFASVNAREYLLAYWDGECFELLDSKTGRTSNDHEISFASRLPNLTFYGLLSAVLLFAAKRLKSHAFPLTSKPDFM